MPALSPTMTEGNITNWRVKEGDKFAAGDVLLEIETDKATMDVEAQEDGVMVKIMTGDGAKAVQVGKRIAVIAEEGDDVGALEMPADSGPEQPARETAAAAESGDAPAPEAAGEASETEAPASGDKKAHAPKEQTYPLFPSVSQLLRENGVDKSKVKDIPATGPKGRLTKGDVLVYLGKAKSDSASNGEALYNKLSHLDLSNIKVAEKKAEPKKVEAAPAKPAVQEVVSVRAPVSLASVIEVQKKVHKTLGVFLPLSTFISRATDVANDELPLPANTKPSSNELFNQILGLDKVGPKGSRGHYLPQISALPPPPTYSQRALGSKPADIYDILAGPSKKAPAKTTRPSGLSTGINMFALTVPKEEERRAKAFLERVKTTLENEPGRLVL